MGYITENNENNIATVHMIANRDNDVLYCGESEVSHTLKNDIINHSVEYSTDLVKSIFLPKEVILSSELETYGLNLVMKFPLDSFNAESNNIALLIIIVMLITIIVPLGLFIYFALKHYATITSLITEFEDGFSVVKVGGEVDSISETNELSFIKSKISDLIETSKQYENDLANHILQLKKAQICIMQNQINPHFIFNTLNNINLIIINELGMRNVPSTMISNLAIMLSEVMDTENLLTTVEKEINYVKSYLEIEKTRYQNNFEVIWNIDKKVLKYQTIKMIIQPIVENALKHGIFQLSASVALKYIKIEIQEVDKSIIITIEDNGVGIEQENLLQIQKKLKDNAMPESKHIGLLNVNFRIKTLYGDEYGCFISSEEEGTRVKVKIPMGGL